MTRAISWPALSMQEYGAYRSDMIMVVTAGAGEMSLNDS
eukprot:CAMPEP_0183704580 /NCGR_PEP_ID=MMETSP0737-20130205/1871_1 /TAXON_ID=385413 /ORGANISM="Thalassiosira miniscula, Strain CCMP1093" /LENGTH=38 /DNA_ID= /DNA_START= /DNA_END= /DNA_ORIENTATION=